MSRRGRSAKPRGVFEFEGALLVPEQVILDSSFVVEALVTSQPLNGVCSAFLTELAQAGSRVVFNRLLELEVAEAVFRIALRERHPRGDWRRLRDDGRTRRRGATLLREVRSSWEASLRALSWTCVEVHEVIGQTTELMARYGLSSYDAVHVATVMFAETPDLVTLDPDFAVVPQRHLRLHVPRARSASCRRIRTKR